jgi:hypothetical protein
MAKFPVDAPKQKVVRALEDTFELAEMGLVPGGAHKNREFREAIVDFSSALSR